MDSFVIKSKWTRKMLERLIYYFWYRRKNKIVLGKEFWIPFNSFTFLLAAMCIYGYVKLSDIKLLGIAVCSVAVPWGIKKLYVKWGKLFRYLLLKKSSSLIDMEWEYSFNETSIEVVFLKTQNREVIELEKCRQILQTKDLFCLSFIPENQSKAIDRLVIWIDLNELDEKQKEKLMEYRRKKLKHCTAYSRTYFISMWLLFLPLRKFEKV